MLDRVHVFLLVPAFKNTGPIKGVVAMANDLVRSVGVTVVALRRSDPFELNFDSGVQIECLDCDKLSMFPLGIWWYRKIISSCCEKSWKVSISVGFSADVLNVFASKADITVSSVRGNLIENYIADYGWKGSVLARVHYLLFRLVQQTIVMNKTMQSQVLKMSGVHSHIVGNFIDETQLCHHRIARTKGDLLRFVFVGSISKRKRVDRFIGALRVLLDRGFDVRADVIGDGPLRQSIENLAEDLLPHGRVKLHGALPNPYAVLQQNDVFVLPSSSEGVSRASLEALYFGLPIVLADVDGNKDLVTPEVNGFLVPENFSEIELADAMFRAYRLFDTDTLPDNLLPMHCRQADQVQSLLRIVARADEPI